jgi:2-polyprenyl-6-methoxyphenol hydroxylase-like FAD-dependent oxidoreductase
MTAHCIDTPVLIVGGGPVGLALAIELGWRGIDCTLIEQGDGSVDHPRLGVILTRTMEICRRWGIVERVYDCGFSKDYKLDIAYCTSLTGHVLARDSNPSCGELAPPPQSPEKRQRCPQLWFNPILQAAASEYDTVRLRHFCRLEAFREHADHVEVQAVDARSGESATIRARYMVACDGAASVVRNRLRVPMLGNPALSYSVNLFVRCPEMLQRHTMGEAERYIFVGPQGTWANMTVVDGRQLWRFTINGSEKTMDLSTFDAHAAIAKCIGETQIPYELISVKPWRRTELTAAQFRHGRVFLAGDAAHTMSPTGGHGVSTGIADCVNLAWKIEAELAGWAGPYLLDSYDPERRPVAMQAAAASAKNYRAWTSATDCAAILEDTPRGEETRSRIGKHMLVAGREDWDSLGLQLGYRYDESPICAADGTPKPHDSVIDYVQTARPGARAPHAWLRHGRSTLDLFGKQFVLLLFGAAPEAAQAIVAAAHAQKLPLSVTQIGDPDIAQLYERRMVLVRPDGHVAWRADEAPQDPAKLIGAIRGAVKA